MAAEVGGVRLIAPIRCLWACLSNATGQRGRHQAVLLVFLSLVFALAHAPAASAATQQRTTEWFVFQNINQSITNNQQVNATFTVTVPESSPVVRSAFVEVTVGTVTANGGTVSAGSHICINANSNCTLFAAGPAESGETQFYTFLANVTGFFEQEITAPGNFTQNLTIRLNNTNGQPVQLLSAKLYLTYDYDDSSTVQIKTVRFFAGQKGTTLTSGSTNIFPLAPINLPESGVTVRSAFFEIRGQNNNDVKTNSTFNISLDSVQNLTAGTGVSLSQATATVFGWTILYNVSYDPTTSHTLHFKNQAGPIQSGLNAELVLTYEYNNAASPTQLKTIEHFIGQNTSVNQVAQLNFTSNVYIPEENTAIRSVYARVIEASDGNTAGTNLTIRAFRGAEGSSIKIGPYDGGAEITGGIVALFNATDPSDLGSMAKGENNVTCQVKSTTGGSSPGCFLVVTYAYNASSRTQLKATRHFVGTGVRAAAAKVFNFDFALNVPGTLFQFNNVTLDTVATSAASPTSTFSNISIGTANNTQTCGFESSGEVLRMRCWDDVSDLVNTTGSFPAFVGSNVNVWPSSILILTYLAFNPFVETFNTTAFIDVATNFTNDETVFSRAQSLTNGSSSYRFTYRNASGVLLCQNTNATTGSTNRTDAAGCNLASNPNWGSGYFTVEVERVFGALSVSEANATFLVRPGRGAPTTTAPIVTINSPTNTTYAQTSVWVNVTLNEDSGNVTAQLDGTTNYSLTNSSGNWNYLLTGLTDGAHNVRIFANDGAGNMNSGPIVYFTVTVGCTTSSANGGNVTIEECADYYQVRVSGSNDNVYYINKRGVLYSNDFSNAWAKIIPEVNIKKNANWYNWTLMDLDTSSITVINNDTDGVALRFDYNKTIGAVTTYFREAFVFNSSNDYVLIRFSVNLTTSVGDSYFKVNINEIKINNTENNDLATFITSAGIKKYVNLINTSLDASKKKSQVHDTYFELVDGDTGKYAWIRYNLDDIGISENYHVKGGNYPNASVDFTTRVGSSSAGVYTLSYRWNDPTENKVLFQHFEATRAGEPSLPKDFFIKNNDEFAGDDSSAWPYSPLISNIDTSYFLVNATLLKSAGLWPASRAVEVAPNATYVLSFFVSNVTFQGRLQEFGNIWYAEFDENATEQDNGDMVIFNSTHAWTDHPQLFTVGREPISEWTKINASFTTSPDTRYIRFGPSFQNVRSSSFYYIDNIEVARR